MNWRIILGGWLLMLILAKAFGLLDFRWEVTLGDIALGVIAACITIALSIYNFWRPRHPFTVKFYGKKWDSEDEENPGTDWLILNCKRGQPETFFIGVRLKTERTFKTVDIRLNRFDIGWFFRTGFWYREPPKTIAYIQQIKDQQFPWDRLDKDNKKGGREAEYRDPIHFPLGSIMWYEVTAIAHENWNGRLAFQLRRGSSHKGIGRAQLCFKVAPQEG